MSDTPASSVPATPLLEVRLPDGTPVLLRPIVPADREAVREAFRRLSPDSRYYRFWTRQEQMPDSLLQRFLCSDHFSQDVWAAQDPTQPLEIGYGAASWFRDAQDPTLAEVSLTIADEAQHRGFGTLLLAVLWRRARQRGISRFFGVALAENQTAVEWFRALGAHITWAHGQYTFHLPLEMGLLPANPTAQRLRYWLDTLEADFPEPPPPAA